MECKLRYFLSITILLLWSFCTVASANDDEVFIWRYYGGGAVCEGFVDSHKNDVNAIIPETVTDGGETRPVVGIGPEAFKGLVNLESVELPSTLKRIYRYAFRDCISLSSIKLPSTVASIDEHAFEGCSKLESVELPPNIESLGMFVFDNCSNLKAVKIPSSITKLEDGLFFRCSSLQSVELPSNLTSIAGSVFTGCKSLTSLDIPSTVTSIGSSAFADCDGLISMEIPSGVTEIAADLFEGCDMLETIKLPAGITSIGKCAFYGCKRLTSLNLPSGVKTIGESAFEGCSSLQTLILSSGLKSLGSSAFRYCDKLVSMVLPSGITDISSCMFEYCKSIESVELPLETKTIGGGAFEGCTSLVNIDLPSGITSIGTGAFHGCTSLASLTLPENLVKIGNYSLANCSSLVSLEIPSSVVTIPPYFAMGCASLKTITIGKGVKQIYGGAFCRCFQLESLICNSMQAPSFCKSVKNDYWLSDGECTDDLCDETLYSKVMLKTLEGSTGYGKSVWAKFANRTSGGMAELTDENGSITPDVYPVGNLTYTRNGMVEGSYVTFCLPFNISVDDVSDKLESIYVPNNTALYKPEGKLVLLMQKLDAKSSVPAKQAFVAKLKAGVNSVTFSNNKLTIVDEETMQNPTPTSLQVFDWNGTSGILTENTDVKVSFGGVLTTMTDRGSEYEIFNSDGTFTPTTDGVVRAFRAYVLKENETANSKIKQISFGLEDETTGIEWTVAVGRNVDNAIYTIDGRLVNITGVTNGLPSGLYIRNRQKILVK